MRWPGAVFVLIAFVLVIGCNQTKTKHHTPTEWKTGFWFWEGSYANAGALPGPVDTLYVEAGHIEVEPFTGPLRPWGIYGELPAQLPPAREYWLTYRYEDRGLPGPPFALQMARRVSEQREAARRRGLTIAGIQFDIDSPTGSLSEYAAFLREVRKALGPNVHISITALLDWFRSGTSIGDVVAAVDEFVPQFYDADEYGSNRQTIARRLEAARWAPVFNRFGKPYRLGLSSFGRARLAPKERASSGGHSVVAITVADVRPLDTALNPAFQLQVAQTDAGELRLRYEATHSTRLGYGDMGPGDAIEFVIATPMRSEWPSTRRGGWGAIAEASSFFAGLRSMKRWPQRPTRCWQPRA